MRLYVVCRDESQPETDGSVCHSSVNHHRDAEMKFSLQIVSVNDAEFENSLREAVVNGN